VPKLDPPRRCKRLAQNVSAEMKKLGYQGGALVLFGESSAYPHGLPKPRSLAENQVVLVDGGLSVHGYQSDMTRTVVFGTPSANVPSAPTVQPAAPSISEGSASWPENSTSAHQPSRP